MKQTIALASVLTIVVSSGCSILPKTEYTPPPPVKVITEEVKTEIYHPRLPDEIELENTEPFVIDVNENGQYFIEEDGGNVQVSLGFLEDRFARVIQTNPDIEIIVRGDQKTSYQSIAELLSVLQANGANNFSLATQP